MYLECFKDCLERDRRENANPASGDGCGGKIAEYQEILQVYFSVYTYRGSSGVINDGRSSPAI